MHKGSLFVFSLWKSCRYGNIIYQNASSAVVDQIHTWYGSVFVSHKNTSFLKSLRPDILDSYHPSVLLLPAISHYFNDNESGRTLHVEELDFECGCRLNARSFGHPHCVLIFCSSINIKSRRSFFVIVVKLSSIIKYRKTRASRVNGTVITSKRIYILTVDLNNYYEYWKLLRNVIEKAAIQHYCKYCAACDSP